MDEILNELSVWVLPAILMFTAVGVLCGLCAVFGIMRENRLLKKCRDKNIFSDSGKRSSARIEILRAYLKELRSNEKNRARIGHGKLLQLRLETISDAIASEGVKVMPTLHDLHSLSMQDEMSRISSVWLRTITSFLLIMGIFGTLAGVHNVMSSGAETQITSLRDALEPSMYAVFFTVLLMWLRGFYVAKLDSYLERLDLFTITEIIPTMQPVTKVQNTAHDLSHHFIELQKKVSELENLNAGMNALQSNLSGFLEKMRKNTDDVSRLREQVDGVHQKLNEAQNKAVERREALAQLVQVGQTLESGIVQGVQDMSLYVESVNQRCAEVEVQYNQLLANLHAISADIGQSRSVMNELSDKAGKMNQIGQSASQYESVLASVSGELEQVHETAKQMEQLRDEISASKNVVLDSSGTAQQILLDTQQLVAQIEAINAPFADSVRIGEENLKAALDELKTLTDEFESRSEKIRQEWVKRAKQIGI